MPALDTSGRLLEGIRTSTGNNSFTFPARNFVSNNSTFQAVQSRAEYAIVVGSVAPADKEMEIADPNLRFYYTKNESNVVRFDYDNYSRRFFPAPGGSPNELGPIENDPRLVMPVPDLTLTSAPIDLYIGSTVRTVVFSLVTVPTDGDFTNPISISPGTVEISEESGKLNFSQSDINTYEDQIIIATRQSFSDRTQADGAFGVLPTSAALDYYIFLNPKPASGQVPRIRIDYQPHLLVYEVPDEASLGSPAGGTCHWSADTGRVRFSEYDLPDNLGRTVYYDGVFLGAKQLPSTVVGSVVSAYPSSAFIITGAIGTDNASRFIISAELSGVRHYFPITLVSGAFSGAPSPGTAKLDVNTGAVYLSVFDLIIYTGWEFSYTDTIIELEDGVSVQFYRSGVNGSRAPSAPDFVITYGVEEQRIVGKIGLSPIVLLPTIPLVDDTLAFDVEQVVGSVGSFVGSLSDGEDSTELGNGYLLDLSQKMLKFSARKSITKQIVRPVSTIKLDDSALSQFGFESTKNGSSITPGIDYVLDFDSGLVDFVQPVGENDPDNILGISGSINFTGTTFLALNGFTADTQIFSSDDVGKYLYVQSGDNVGIYKITRFISTKKVTVTPNFKALGDETVDLRVGVEVIADRFWAPFLPPYKKFSLSKAVSVDGEYIEIENTEFDVFKNTGQVNLDQPTFPGEHYQISYVSLETEDDGVTQTPTNRVEKALFRIRQEEATVIFPGTSTPSAGQSVDRTAFLDALGEVDPEDRSCDDPVAGPLVISTAVPKLTFDTSGIISAGNETEESETSGTSGTITAGSTLQATSTSSSSGFKVGFVFGAPTGSRTAVFNPNGYTVSTERPIEVFVNGVPLEDSDFTFESPGTLKFVTPIAEDQTVILNYWVEDAQGNESNFELLHSPIDLDTPEIVAGQDTAEFNGNQTSLLSPGSAILINKTEIIIVETATYDSANDVTSVKFEVTPTISSSGAPLQATGPITGDYRLAEQNAVDVFSQGANAIKIAGDRTFCYVEGTIVTVDGDPYIVVSSEYDQNTNQTSVSVSGAAKRNYIIPSVTRTIRPVLSPSGSFITRYEAHSDFPFTLVKMGTERSVLVQGVDYDVSDGGSVQLSTEVEFGDSLFAMYVARDRQSFGTTFIFNYSYAIAPNETNGLLGQELLATYNLYAPDSFFYRAETVETFLPEVSDLLKQGSQSSSGPNISDVASATNTKDSGTASPWFEEMHQENLDITIARLLKYYNDLINLYEDILSNLDGRIVGGNYGRFRFDGNFDNPPRNNYWSITNDIDDQTKLYDQFTLTGFFSFDTLPVYGRVGQPNKYSRIFPTVRTATVAINDQISFWDFGNTLGNLGIGNLRSTGNMISSRGRAFIDAIDSTGKIFTIEKNGDSDNLIPKFEVGQKVRVHNLNGAPEITGKITIVIDAEPATIVLDTATTLQEGSLLRYTGDTDDLTADPTLSYYTPGKDLSIDLESGQVNNMTFPEPLHSLFQENIKGDEILDCVVEFNNTNSAPARIPVLDGEELNDDGSLPAPLLKRIGEDNLLNQELVALNLFGSAVVQANRTTVSSSTIVVSLGKTIRFVNGPNSGESRIVSSVVGPTIFNVLPPFSNADLSGSDFVVSTASGDDLVDILNDELKILNTNVEAAAVSPAQVGVLNSEITTVENIIYSYGEVISSGSGSVSGVTLTDLSANFTADGANEQSLLYIPSGDNWGLYKVSAATANQITVDDTAPFTSFPVIGTVSYYVIDKSNLITDAGPEFITEFLRETVAFLNDTQTLISNPSISDKASRLSGINNRLSQIDGFVTQLEGVLTGEQTYDIRYLWIDQRTNRKTGTFVKKIRAVEQRQEDIQKIIDDQKKLLVVNAI